MPEEELVGGATGAETLKVRGALPRKRRVNLAYVTRTRIPWGRILLGLLGAVALCTLFVRVGIQDRFEALREAREKLAATQEQYDQASEILDEYYESRDVYVHITWSDMTAEEIGLVDPSDVTDLLERMILPVSPLDGWTLSDNSVHLSIRTDTLEQANDLAHQLRREPMVKYCAIQNGGRTLTREGEDDGVTSELIILFNSADNSKPAAAQRNADAGEGGTETTEAGGGEA